MLGRGKNGKKRKREEGTLGFCVKEFCLKVIFSKCALSDSLVNSSAARVYTLVSRLL